MTSSQADELLKAVETGEVNSWEGVHQHLDLLWNNYEMDRCGHAYHVLCMLRGVPSLSSDDYNSLLARYAELQQLVSKRVAACRKKDADNAFRQSTFFNDAEMNAVMK